MRPAPWQRGPNPSYFMKTLSVYIAWSPFSNFVQPPSLLPKTPTSTSYSVVLFLWLNGWSRHIWSAILLNGIMDVHMSSLKTWWMCVLCNKALGFIVCNEVSTPFKNTSPLFFAKHPPLNLQTVKVPPF